MGISHIIYRHKGNVEIGYQLQKMHALYLECIKDQDTEYNVNFILKNIEKFETIKTKWNIKDDAFSLYNHEFITSYQQIKALTQYQSDYDWSRVYSEGYYDEQKLGFEIKIDIATKKIEFEIGLPYYDLDFSANKVSELFAHLDKQGMDMGFSESDIKQFIQLHASTSMDTTWQLNNGHLSLIHGKMFAPNSKFEQQVSSYKYRICTMRIGYPDWYFKERNLTDYVANLIDALSLYFVSENLNCQFRSKNLGLINLVNHIDIKNPRLAASLDFSTTQNPLRKEDIDDLFETGENEIWVSHLRLNSADKIHFDMQILGRDDNHLDFNVRVAYKAAEDFYKKIESKLGFELECAGAE